MDNNENALLEQKIENIKSLLDNRITRLEQECGTISTKVMELEKQNTKTDVQYQNIMKTLEKLSNQVEEIKNKPAKRWDTVITSILGAICGVIGGAIAGFLFKQQS